MRYNLIKDLNFLTTIPENTLNKIKDISIYSICNDIEESTLEKDSIVEIDLGIGDLIVGLDEKGIKYKFIPSKKMEENIQNTFLQKKNPLTINIEKSLIKKLTNIYKDLI